MGAFEWFLTVTPHAARVAGGTLRTFWPSGGGKIVIATSGKVLGTAGTTAAWAGAAKVAAEVAVVAVVVAGTVYLLRRLRTP